MRQAYASIRFNAKSVDLINRMNAVINDLQSQGYTLSVRQLYYQMVARAVIENSQQSYKRLTNLVNDARMAGEMDWAAIEDRTREFITRSHWSGPRQILRGAAEGFHMDMWETQPCRVFVIVEKEALVGVLKRPCTDWDVPLLAARGFPSSSVLREFARDMVMEANSYGQDVTILHFGDHDPSGIDMTRDLRKRIEVFAECEDLGYSINLVRVALTMDQIEDQRPPPNPAKKTDSRYRSYMREFGSESWELDALSPRYLTQLVEQEIESLHDEDAWAERKAEIEHGRAEIYRVGNLIKDPK